jgi:hypothetical protein
MREELAQSERASAALGHCCLEIGGFLIHGRSVFRESAANDP